jgi:NADPH:quinone reductase-like Zn-dependent oxidoreductase
MVEHEFPVVLGRDYAGVVEQAGSAVTGYAVGDEVFGFRERYPDGVDALADFASGSPDQLNAYAAVVRDGGRIISSAGTAGEGTGRINVGAAPTTENLERLAGLLEDGTLSVPIQASYPLAQVDQALKDLAGQHTQGKLAVTLP